MHGQTCISWVLYVIYLGASRSGLGTGNKNQFDYKLARAGLGAKIDTLVPCFDGFVRIIPHDIMIKELCGSSWSITGYKS